jgi:hypothetical protein
MFALTPPTNTDSASGNDTGDRASAAVRDASTAAALVLPAAEPFPAARLRSRAGEGNRAHACGSSAMTSVVLPDTATGAAWAAETVIGGNAARADRRVAAACTASAPSCAPAAESRPVVLAAAVAPATGSCSFVRMDSRAPRGARYSMISCGTGKAACSSVTAAAASPSSRGAPTAEPLAGAAATAAGSSKSWHRTSTTSTVGRV